MRRGVRNDFAGRRLSLWLAPSNHRIGIPRSPRRREQLDFADSVAALTTVLSQSCRRRICQFVMRGDICRGSSGAAVSHSNSPETSKANSAACVSCSGGLRDSVRSQRTWVQYQTGDARWHDAGCSRTMPHRSASRRRICFRIQPAHRFTAGSRFTRLGHHRRNAFSGRKWTSRFKIGGQFFSCESTGSDFRTRLKKRRSTISHACRATVERSASTGGSKEQRPNIVFRFCVRFDHFEDFCRALMSRWFRFGRKFRSTTCPRF